MFKNGFKNVNIVVKVLKGFNFNAIGGTFFLTCKHSQFALGQHIVHGDRVLFSLMSVSSGFLSSFCQKNNLTKKPEEIDSKQE